MCDSPVDCDGDTDVTETESAFAAGLRGGMGSALVLVLLVGELCWGGVVGATPRDSPETSDTTLAAASASEARGDVPCVSRSSCADIGMALSQQQVRP